MDRASNTMKFFSLISVISIAIFIGSCDKLPLPFGKDKKSEGPKKIIVTSKPPPTVTPSTPLTPPIPLQPKEEKRPFVYDPSGKRDPFRPFIEMQTPVKPSDERIPLTPLQKYDLSQLKLVAILVGKEGGRAMVEDSEGKGYIITKGTYIGRNFGKVKIITKNLVIIEEQYKDYLGNIKPKEIEFRLHAPGEEKKP